MRETIRRVLRARFVALTSVLAALLAVLAAVLPYLALRSVPAPLIVHFTDALGIDRVGSLWDIASIGALAVVAVSLNSLIAIELEKRNLFWGKFVSLGTLCIAALIFIGVLAIISVN